MTDMLDLTTSEILAGYAAKTFSPSDYMTALNARIEAAEPVVAALWDWRPEQALAEAAASTERWARGAPRGALDGVPATIKELIATKGDPVPLGTAATELVPAAADAPTAARLREDGAILFAKTTCPDYGMLSSGLSTFHKLSRNPWDPSQNPGGSSAGAASAGAAGLGPIHIGTDIGGSVRLPAGWTGLFGFKPSLGRIPIEPYYTGRCAGPMTRSIDDAAHAMASITRPDWRDATSLPYEAIDWHAPALEVKGLKLGLMLDAGCGLDAEPEVRAAVIDAARRFEAAGAEIIEIPAVLTREMLDGLDVFWRARFWGQMESLSPERRAMILPYILEWAQGGEHLRGVAAAQGFDRTMEMRATCARAFQAAGGLDAILSPVNPTVSYPAEWASPTNDPARPFEHICFTMPWNMGEQPACSINCGFASSGIPIGLQIVAPRFEDLRVMRLARAFESWTGGVTNWPRFG